MPEIVESKQYELFCNEQMIKSEFRQMWANKKRHEMAAKSINTAVFSRMYKASLNLIFVQINAE